MRITVPWKAGTTDRCFLVPRHLPVRLSSFLGQGEVVESDTLRVVKPLCKSSWRLRAPRSDYFRFADYAARDSMPSRPSPIGPERCEHSQIRLRSYSGSDCKLAVPA